MNSVELQIPAKALLEVFEAKSVSTGMTQAVPGGGTLSSRWVDKRAHGALPLVPVMLMLGSGDAINLVSGWLCDKLKHANVQQILIEGTEVEVTAESITKPFPNPFRSTSTSDQTIKARRQQRFRKHKSIPARM